MLIAVLKNKPTLSFFVIIFGTLSFPIKKKGINTLSLIEVSGVVNGTTVRALVLGRFSQKKLKIELKEIRLAYRVTSQMICYCNCADAGINRRTTSTQV